MRHGDVALNLELPFYEQPWLIDIGQPLANGGNSYTNHLGAFTVPWSGANVLAQFVFSVYWSPGGYQHVAAHLAFSSPGPGHYVQTGRLAEATKGNCWVQMPVSAAWYGVAAGVIQMYSSVYIGGGGPSGSFVRCGGSVRAWKAS